MAHRASPLPAPKPVATGIRWVGLFLLSTAGCHALIVPIDWGLSGPLEITEKDPRALRPKAGPDKSLAAKTSQTSETKVSGGRQPSTEEAPAEPPSPSPIHLQPKSASDSPEADAATDAPDWPQQLAQLQWQPTRDKPAKSSATPTYGWTHAGLEKLLQALEPAEARKVLHEAAKQSAGPGGATAVIGLARLGDVEQRDRLGPIAANEQLPLPTRQAAVEMIGYGVGEGDRDDQGTRQLEPLLVDSHPQIRAEALLALAKSTGDEAHAQVKRALDDHELSVRVAALTALGRLPGPESQKILVERLTSSSERLREAAIHALTEFGDATTVYAAATDTAWRVRRAVAQSLAAQCDARSKEIARTLLADRSAEVGLAVVNALAAWPLPDAGAILLLAAESDTPRIRQAAIGQLAQRWEPATTLSIASVPQAQHDRLRQLRQQWSEEFQQAPPATWTSVEKRNGTPLPKKSQEPHVARAQLIEWLEQYMNQDDAMLEASQQAATQLKAHPMALIELCQYQVLDQHLLLDDAVYTELLAQGDPQFRWVEQLGSAEVAKRREAVAELIKLSSRQALLPLALHRAAEIAVRESDPQVWRDLLKAVAQESSDAVQRLAHAAATHPAPEIRRYGCRYLLQHPETSHEAVLLTLLNDLDPAVQQLAVQALGAGGQMADTTPLKNLLASDNKELRVKVAMALAQVGSSSGPAALERLAYDDDAAIRMQVATALSSIKNEACIPTMMHLLQDNHAIRRAALTALKETAGTPTEIPAKDEVALIQQWQEWFQQRPAKTPASSDRQSHRPRKSTPQS